MVQNIVSYHAQVKEKIKVFAQQKKNLPEDVSGVVFIGKHNHEQTLNSMLSFLEFLIIQSNYQVTLGTHNIDTLWQIFV